MKKVLYTMPYLVLVTLTLLINGCKKSSTSSNSGGNGGGAASSLVGSYTEKNTTNGVTQTTVYTYSYDGQNRLIGLQYSNGSPSVTFSYGAGTVTKTVGTAVTVYTLNNAGLAVSDNQGNSYTYDGNGYLTNITNVSGASTVNTVSGGNIVNSVQTTSGGASTTYSYTFLTNPNSLKDGLTFTGAVDVNLVQSESISGLGSFPFSYTFDSDGRVQALKIISGNSTLVRTYSYVN